MTRSSKVPPFLKRPHRTPVGTSPVPIRATCFSHLIPSCSDFCLLCVQCSLRHEQLSLVLFVLGGALRTMWDKC